MAKKSKKTDISKKNMLATRDILKPVKLEDIGSTDDPCFGKGYDLSTPECKICGDSELCCIQVQAGLGKTRKTMEKENHYKDIEDKLDIPAVKAYYRSLKRKGKLKKEILDSMQNKYELTRKEARTLYRDFSK